MAEFTIYHNPQCTKSRAALALLQAQDATLSVIEYLKQPPSAAELADVVRKLRIKPEELVRKAEDVYKTKYAGKQLSDAQWIDAMVNDPVLIERPIVIRGERAVIGRPTQNVEQFLAE